MFYNFFKDMNCNEVWFWPKVLTEDDEDGKECEEDEVEEIEVFI